MSKPVAVGTFKRKGLTYQVFVKHFPASKIIDEVIIVHADFTQHIKPQDYDKTNKLHVNGFIIVTENAFKQKDVVIDPLPENWPTDYRLHPVGTDTALFQAP